VELLLFCVLHSLTSTAVSATNGLAQSESWLSIDHSLRNFSLSLIQGEHGAMGESRLESERGNFGRNKTDVFEIMGSVVGPLKEATVRMVG